MDDDEIRRHFRPPTDEEMEAVNASIRKYEQKAREAAKARVNRVVEILKVQFGRDYVQTAKLLIEDIESDAYPSHCPYDCDSCHDEDCPCDRLGCAGSECPGAK